MVDVWLIFCQLIPFTEVILLTVKEYKRKEGAAGEDEAGPPNTIHQHQAPDMPSMSWKKEMASTQFPVRR